MNGREMVNALEGLRKAQRMLVQKFTVGEAML